MFEHPAQEGGIETAWLERQVGRIRLLQRIAIRQPWHAVQSPCRRTQLRNAQVDAGGV